METTYPKAPEDLSPRSRELWNQLVGSRVKSSGRLVLFEQALRALDRADSARAIIDREGMTTTTASTGAVHVNPIVKIEKEARQLFATIWDRMRLDFDPAVDGRGG